MLTPQQVNDLIKHQSAHSVSIWMPTQKAGAETQQGPIRMKNLLDRAEQHLQALGLRPPEAAARLDAIREITGDGEFWRHRSLGLAVLASDDNEPTVLNLPVSPPELVTVCDHYHLKPLFGRAGREECFYILELSQNQVQLVRAKRSGVEAVELPGAPDSFEQFLRFDDPEAYLQYHSETAPHQPAENRPAVFHGQGAAGDQDWENQRLKGYVSKIDQAVCDAVTRRPAPLVLAATEPLDGMYHELSSCRQLSKKVIRGNPDREKQDELARKGMELLAEESRKPIQQALEEWRTATGHDRARSDLEETLQAATVSAVDKLLVAVDEQHWGRYDAASKTLTRHDAQEPGDDDLLNTAAVLAGRTGAEVLAVPRDELPADSPVAATLRFNPQS